jgi:DNA repair exonuclease SbcCD ATPase subunit
MAKKATSFADKIRKNQEAVKRLCPVCNTEFQRVKFVKSVESENKNSWRFNQNMVDVCKCNEKEVFVA